MRNRDFYGSNVICRLVGIVINVELVHRGLTLTASLEVL